MAKFAAERAETPVAAGLRELALTWEARARMKEIDGALRAFYRDAVKFPDALAAVMASIPANAKTDPWNEPWVYAPGAPTGFSAKFSKQRYQLGPKRLPQLTTIAEAVSAKPWKVAWKITQQAVAGNRAVMIVTPAGQRAVVQAGGKVGDVSILSIGDGWLLAADTEQLFGLNF